MKWQVKTLVLGSVALLAFASAAFGVTRATTSRSNHAGIESPTVGVAESPIVGSHRDYPVAQSVEEQVSSAQIILIGTVASVGGVVNTAFDADDPYRQLGDIFGVGRLYHIQVERYLKGEGPTDVTTIQVENYLNLSKESAEIRKDPGKVAPAPDVQAMRPGDRYVFFLRKSVKKEIDYLLPGIEPYRYALAGDKASPQGVYKESSKALPERNVTEFLSQIISIR